MNIPTFNKQLPIVALLTVLFAMPVGAASSAASSASDSVAASVGSFSGSLIQSSNSSKGRQVADGDYRIIEIAAEPGRTDAARLTLVANAVPTEQAVLGQDESASFQLILPRPVLTRTGLAEGATISARQRPYGLEFAEGQPRRSFFLVMHDEWFRELQSTPVSL